MATTPEQHAMAKADDADWEDWEDWDGKSKFSHHMFAGSCAGIVEHLAMFPVDTIRTFKQTHVIDSSRISLKSLYKEGGIARLYRGASSVIAACVPAHAAYFSIYEVGKKHLVNQPGHHPLAAAVCGATATFAHDCFMTPLDVVKQRLQLGFYSGVTDCIRKVIKYEGVRALFVSFPTTLLMNIPYGGVMVATNESLKTVLNPSGERNIPAFFLSGAGAGALAALVTNPMDVAKTRLQTQCILVGPAASGLNFPNAAAQAIGNTPSSTPRSTKVSRRQAPRMVTPSGLTAAPAGLSTSSRAESKSKIVPPNTRKFSNQKLKCETLRCTAQVGQKAIESCKVVQFTGLMDTLRTILKEEGLRGFTRGLKPRLLVHIPSVATTWTTYEIVKRLLVEYDD